MAGAKSPGMNDQLLGLREKEGDTDTSKDNCSMHWVPSQVCICVRAHQSDKPSAPYPRGCEGAEDAEPPRLFHY